MTALLGLASCLRAAPPVALSPGERAWLSAHPVIRVGYDPNWPPFTLREPDGRLGGIDADVLHLIAQRLNVDFTIVSTPDWNTTYDEARAHRIDLVLSMAPTAERTPYFLFSKPYLTFPLAIITRDDAPFVWSASDLKRRRVAVVPGYAITERVAPLTLAGNAVPVRSMEEALVAVARGRADATVTNLANATWIITNDGLTNLKIAGLMPASSVLRYAVRRDWPELVVILDKAIASLTPDEINAINDRWIHVQYSKVIRWDVIFHIGLASLIVLGLGVGAVVYHNRRLARELAARIRLQAEIERARDQLKRLSDDKTWLLEMAAHDLRNPLTTIQLLSEVSLKHGAMSAAEALARIDSQTAAMLALLNDLLDVQAIEDGRRIVARRAVDLGSLALGVLRTQEAAAGAKRIRLEGAGLEGAPPVLGDELALRQVIENLVSNALKYSPPGSTVRVSASVEASRLHLAVRDEGPGVPEADRERIFGKYARGDAQPTGGEKSTGLGLAIVRSLMAAMGGQVWCEPAGPDGGAVFVVALPLSSRIT